MAFSLSLGSRRQAVLLIVLAVVLVLAVVRWRPGGGPAPAATSAAVRPRAAGEGVEEPAAPRAGRPRSREKEVTADEVPLLSAEDFAIRPAKGSADTGRDLFGSQREPTKRPPPTPYPPPPPPGDTRFVGPLPPPGPTPTPKPPEITFKFVGTFGPKAHPIAVIQEGDKVYNVREGDVLFDKFVLRSVGYESLEIGFVDYPGTKPTRIGITPN